MATQGGLELVHTAKPVRGLTFKFKIKYLEPAVAETEQGFGFGSEQGNCAMASNDE